MIDIGQFVAQKNKFYVKSFLTKNGKKKSVAKPSLLVHNSDIVKFTYTQDKSQKAKIIEVIDKNEDEIDKEIIKTKFGLHPLKKTKRKIKKELQTLLNLQDPFSPRVQIFDKFIVTIDGETAKDLDDAVSVEKTKSGYELCVYIADVSLFVKKNSAIDKEAQKRGTSIYFGNEVIPMLPPLLSNDYCSLTPDKPKYVMAVQMQIDTKGNIIKKKIFPAIIQTKHKLSYKEVNQILKFPQMTKLYSHLKLMKDLKKILLKKRQSAGSIYFNLSETISILNASGKVEKLIRKNRGMAEEIIEEFMLLTNQVVAHFLFKASVPLIYRTHAIPEEFKLENFNQSLVNLRLKQLDIANIHPKIFQKLIYKIKDEKLKTIITYLILRTMQTAKYSTKNDGHFGLGFDYYTHFTSPIRRYPDLIIHRLLKNILLQNKKLAYSKKELEYIAEHSSNQEKKATEIERAYMGLKQSRFMKNKIGHIYSAIISGVSENGIFVELTKYPIYGMIPFFLLRNDYYIFSKTKAAYIGQNTGSKLQLGTSVKVKLAKVDLFRNFIDFELLQVLD